MMLTDTILTNRESEIAFLLIKGDAKKQIAGKLDVAEKTIENHTQNMYKKVNVQSVGAFVSWWFCTNFKIELDKIISVKNIVSIFLICLVIVNEMNDDENKMLRASRVKVRTSRFTNGRRKNDNENFELV